MFRNHCLFLEAIPYLTWTTFEIRYNFNECHQLIQLYQCVLLSNPRRCVFHSARFVTCLSVGLSWFVVPFQGWLNETQIQLA